MVRTCFDIRRCFRPRRVFALIVTVVAAGKWHGRFPFFFLERWPVRCVWFVHSSITRPGLNRCKPVCRDPVLGAYVSRMVPFSAAFPKLIGMHIPVASTNFTCSFPHMLLFLVEFQMQLLPTMFPIAWVHDALASASHMVGVFCR